MPVHLITMIGHSITTLKPMLEHYASLGIDSFWIFVHQRDGRGQAAEQVKELTAPYAGALLRTVDGDWLDAQQRVFAETGLHPQDWFIIADQDEFQIYPSDLPEILAECDRQGFDYVKGALIDRLSEDGSLSPFDPDRPIWRQYPIGAFLTFPVCGGDCRKVVAAKGYVKLSNGGHHTVLEGSGLPAPHLLVQVHHFKWIAGLLEYLQSRTSANSRLEQIVDRESQRFMTFLAANGERIPLEEAGLLAQPCDPYYPKWSAIAAIVNTLELFRRVADMRPDATDSAR